MTSRRPSSYQYASYDYDSVVSGTSVPRTVTTRPSTARPRTGVSTLGVEYERLICAVTESRGLSPTVGLAFINLDRAEGILCQVSDSQTYCRTLQKLEVYNPAQILIANTAANPPSNLVSVIEENADRLRSELVVVDRRFWSEQSGMEYLETLAFAEDFDSLKISIGDNYYAICCFSAALKHLELGLNLTIAANALPIRYESSEGSMMIDSTTVRSLELIQNLNDSRSKHCLFGLLNKTSTPMGARLLRSNILQPLTELDTLESRYDALEELTTNEDMFFGAQSALKKMPDADRFLTYLIVVPKHLSLKVTEQNINNIIALKDFVLKIDHIRAALTGARSQLLKHVYRLCGHHRLRDIQTLLSESINEDTIYAAKPVDLRNQRVYAIKSGCNGLLDVARVTYKESTEDAFNHVTELASKHSLRLELCFDQLRQHYIRLPVSDLEDRTLPAIFINVIRRKKYIECQTIVLRKHNLKISDSHSEIILLSDQVTRELMGNLCAFAPLLFKISDGIATLDMLLSFAALVMTQDYIRPSIGTALALQSARHPIRSTLSPNFIPNDVLATHPRRFQLVTGCNMSGKSTFIRTIALIAVLAQIGCFVPATRAVLPITHQLLARSCATDDPVEANASSFSAEMRAAAYVLAHADSRSLVVVDELGRGTSPADGLAISLAVAEALVATGARVWFVTHFRELSDVLAERAGVASMHLAVDARREGELKMSYRVEDGAERLQRYGLLLASALPFPQDVIDKAERVVGDLEQRARRLKRVSPAVLTARKRRLVLGLKEQLVQAREGRMSDDVLRDWLMMLQRDFVAKMRDVEADAQRDVEMEDDT